MRLIISIDMENAAFGDDAASEVESILRLQVIRHFGCERGESMRLCDSNGNTVGFAKVED